MIDITPYVIDGATLSAVSVTLEPAPTHGALPQYTPRMGVFRQSGSGGWQSLRSASDFASDSPGLSTYNTPHAFYPAFTTDQNNVIDRSTYNYCVRLWNEGGTNSLPDLNFYSLTITLSNITDMRFA